MPESSQACPSCDVPYSDYPGLVASCMELRDLKKRIAKARAAMLRMWPSGKDCNHEAAREVFVALGDVK